MYAPLGRISLDMMSLEAVTRKRYIVSVGQLHAFLWLTAATQLVKVERREMERLVQSM